MPVLFGTCSWNYDSWVDLVYERTHPTAAEYLPEYARKYRTVEIDSWFYRMPQSRDIEDYLAGVDSSFTFTCKAPQDLTLAFSRGRTPTTNPAFLSPELYQSFCELIAPMKS